MVRVTSAPPPIEPGTPGQPEPPSGSRELAGPAPSGDGSRVSLPVALLVYTVLRLALVAALTAVLMIFMPLIIALLFAYALQLPLAYLFFGKWRRQVNDGIARATARRRGERARLQGALSGDPSLVDPSLVDPTLVDRSVIERPVDRSGERAGPGGTDHPSPRS